MNSASRILSIYDTAIQGTRNPSQSVLAVWQDTFRQVFGSTNIDEDEASLCLQTFRSEISLLETKLLEKNCPRELFENALQRIRTIASPLHLGTQWSSVVGNATPPDVRLTLAWAAWVLPSEEHESAKIDIEALAKQFSELQNSIDTADLPPEIRSFMLNQIKILKSALRHHSIAGTAPITEALEKTAGALLKRRRDLKNQELNTSPESAAWLARMRDGLDNIAHLCEKSEQAKNGSLEITGEYTGMRVAWELVGQNQLTNK